MRTTPAVFLRLLLLTVSCCFGSYAQAAATNEVIELPFEFDHSAIIVQAQINGQGPFNAMIDTGVDPSVIDLDLARKIGLNIASVGAPGSGGGTNINMGYETMLPDVQLGSLAAKNIQALAVDLSQLSAKLGKPLQVVFGYSLLRNRILQIDYPRRVIRFYSRSPFRKASHQSQTPQLTTLSFRYHDDVLIDNILVNGRRTTANLDTGSNSYFQLAPAAVVALGLETEASHAPVSKSTGFNGESINRAGKLKNVTIGGISIDSPPVIFYGPGTGRDHEAWGLRIGNAFLKDYILTMDYRKKLITLQKAQSLSENSKGSCFRAKAGLARRDERAYPHGSASEE